MSEATAQPSRSRRRRRRPRDGGPPKVDSASKQLPTVHEFSAGDLVVNGLDGEDPTAAIIGRAGRGGRIQWSFPKGHIEIGERPEQAATREIAEEIGIRGDVLTALGRIEYWFRAPSAIMHKTVHHYLLRFREGELAANDHEVDDVTWVPIEALPSWLAHTDERQLAKQAAALMETLRTNGAAALPQIARVAPRRRPQTHSVARHKNQ